MQQENFSRKSEVARFCENAEIKRRLDAFFKGDHKKIESFKANVIKLSLNPSLGRCNEGSIFKSALNLAELDLDLNPMMGLAYVVSYGGDAQACIGYKGYLVLAERAGKIIKANTVFAKDVFKMSCSGFVDEVLFEPNFEDRDEDDQKWYSENFRGVLIRIKDQASGEVFCHFVGAKKIYKISGLAPSRNSTASPYRNWFQEMHLAKAIKYVLSKMPISNEYEISRAIDLDNQIDIKESREWIKSNQIDISKRIIERNSGADDLIFDPETGEVELDPRI